MAKVVTFGELMICPQSYNYEGDYNVVTVSELEKLANRHDSGQIQ